MTGCVVCDLPEGQYCEFCPSSTPIAITDRDPGDETPNVPIVFGNDLSLRPETTTTTRSYRATYAEVGYPRAAHGGYRLVFRDFIGPDGFLHAVELAEERREDGETLLNVRELT